MDVRDPLVHCYSPVVFGAEKCWDIFFQAFHVQGSSRDPETTTFNSFEASMYFRRIACSIQQSPHG